MITAWSPSGVQRSRSSAALWRALGLGLFLFGLLYTHAASPEATVSHLEYGAGVSVSSVHFESTAENGNVASATLPLSADEQAGGHHDGHGEQHAVHECALGQPPHGPDLAVPCLSPLRSASDSGGMPRLAYPRHSAAQGAVAPIAHSDSAVLRI